MTNKQVFVSFPEGMIKEIDTKVKNEKKYLNRSHFISEACRTKLKENIK